MNWPLLVFAALLLGGAGAWIGDWHKSMPILMIALGMIAMDKATGGM